MKKLLTIIGIIAIAAAAFFALRPARESATDKPIVKIGVALPLTGNMAELGQSAKAAILSAFNTANSDTTNNLHYKVILEDDQFDPMVMKKIADKFVYQDKVNVIIDHFSVGAKVYGQVADQHKIINFHCSFGNAGLLGKYNFQHFLSVDTEVKSVGDFLEKRNLNDVALVIHNLGSGQEFLGKLEPELKSRNIKFHTETFNSGERDFNILIGKIKNKQATFIFAFSPELDILTKEIRKQGLFDRQTIVIADLMAEKYDVYEGAFSIGAVPTPQNLRKQLNLDGPATYANYMYDIANIVVTGYEKSFDGTNIPTSDEVSAAIHSQKEWNGTVGEMSLDTSGQFHSAVHEIVIKNGTPVSVKE